MENTEIEIFYPTNIDAWRTWLRQNHDLKQAVWLVFYNKKSKRPSISWSEAVDVALCFGWIDSKKVKIDEEISHQYFSKRKSRGTWSKINKAKIKLLIEAGLVEDAGLKCIEIAKDNGSWSILDEVEELLIPNDLEHEFEKLPQAKPYFLGLSKSVKKSILHWIVLARRPETRASRVKEVAELANQQQRPKHL